MTPAIQDTLLQLFDHVRQDPNTLPAVSVEDWQEGSVEWQLLMGFRSMLEQMQQLREREEQYRSIFEATYDGLNILDLDGFFVEVNPAFCDMFGYTREELIGLHVSVLAAPESLPILDDVLKTLKAGRGVQTVVAQGLRKDGTAFYVESHSTTTIYIGKPHTLSVSRDITEQVQAQQLLEQRVEERTRELSSLLEISHTVASTLQLKPLLGLVLDQLKTVVDYTGSSILTVEGEELVFLDSRSPTPEEQALRSTLPRSPWRLPTRQLWRLRTHASMHRRRNWPPLKSASGWHANCTTRSPRRSTASRWVCIPLVSNSITTRKSWLTH